MRDPYIYFDKESEIYSLIVQSAFAPVGQRVGGAGVVRYTSSDLEKWSYSGRLLSRSGSDERLIWAPKLYRFKGHFYVVFTETKTRPSYNLHTPNNSLFKKAVRDVLIYRADRIEGPYSFHSTLISNRAVLDASMFFHDDNAYLLYSVEWDPGQGGRIVYSELNESLDKLVDGEFELVGPDADFGAGSPIYPLVTDSPQLIVREEDDELLLFWSTFTNANKYTVVYTDCAGFFAGTACEGPTFQLGVYDGGHQTVFRGAAGKVYISYHQPNAKGKELLVVKGFDLVGLEHDGKGLK
ncbi:family 43 glycosylhydrolase [Granulosicoccaceae sp. 1_MG-2023]|nr:family 43 glycosylhydrolase [Granulosicoccaceae sp. 1_MG-2023]